MVARQRMRRKKTYSSQCVGDAARCRRRPSDSGRSMELPSEPASNCEMFPRTPLSPADCRSPLRGHGRRSSCKRTSSAIIPVANTNRRLSRRGNTRVFKGLCCTHANLRDCAPGKFRALNGAPSLFGRTSPNSVRSDFSSSFQQPESQPRQNFAPCFHRSQSEQSRNTREAQPLCALAEWRVAVAVSAPGVYRKTPTTKGLELDTVRRRGRRPAARSDPRSISSRRGHGNSRYHPRHPRADR